MKNLSRIASLVALSAVLGNVAAQEPAAGQLLYASPSIDDANFERTVLLIVHHDDDGTIALALNRPTWVDPSEAFPDQPALVNYPGELFLGGPNAPNQPLLIFESDTFAPQNARRVIGSIYVTTDISLLDRLRTEALTLPGDSAPRFRLFAGHAAWIPGQLEDEISRGSWDLVPAHADQIFAADPAALWERPPTAGDAVTARSTASPPRLVRPVRFPADYSFSIE
jgi:putative transcriptional regulator